MFPGTRHWCFEMVSLWMWQASRCGRHRVGHPWHELFDHVEECLGFKGLREMQRHPRMVPFGFVIRGKTTRQEDNRHMAATGTLTNALAQLEAIHVGHGG